jgi:4'-phosphopantetheinyl transferase
VPPPLAKTEIHVWEFPTIVSESTLASYTELLSSDERDRASRFHFERDTRRFTVARAGLRTILSAYTKTPAAELRFHLSAHDKPELEPASDIRFNISHSGEMALLGIALSREVGVDIEAVRQNVEIESLAERFFSPHERETIRALPEQDKIAAFFRCWSCKEAFLKAQGVGLSRSLNSFDVEANPALPARLAGTRPDARETERWSLHTIETADGYAAAVSAEGSITEIKRMLCQQG